MNMFTENYHEQLSEAEKLIHHQEETTSFREQYSKLSKEEIITEAESLIQTADVKLSYQKLLELKRVFEGIVADEKPLQIKAWVEAGNDARDFVPQQDELKVKLLDIFNQFQKLREEEKKRAEEEKLANLVKKKAILDKIRNLVENEETDSSLSQVRECMREWREIRNIPKEFQDDVSSQYKVLIDQFYDNLTIYNELKDLDREKNLEIKIDLIKKVEALKNEQNIRKSYIALHKYHEDWKNTGPVRKDITEEIWTRFKGASDEILNSIKAVQQELDEKRKINLEKKTVLIEKAEAAVAVWPVNNKDWQKLGAELDQLFEEWKKIGPVPTQLNEETWNRFQTARNSYYSERKNFFKELQSNKKDNLKLKIELCEKAEALQEASEFNKTADKFQALQEDWKKIGPVPEEQNEVIWKRFRAAFDHFYQRRNKWFEERKSQESGAVQSRENVIKKLEEMISSENKNLTFADLKQIQSEWNNSGFVSGKRFHSLNTKFQNLIDPLFQSLRNQNNEDRKKTVTEYVENLNQSADGKSKLKSEQRRLKETIKKLEEEISTIDNNKSFFALSKNADAVLKQFDDKINKLNQQKDRLKTELGIVEKAL